MGLDARGGVSIAELIVYIPALIIAIVICARHGFTRASGWIYTIILCLIRIIGSICQLLTYSNHSTGLLQTTLIFDSVGISPLLLATLGLLSRLVDWINNGGNQTFTMKHFRLIQLLITVGLILGIAGGTSASVTSSGTIEPATTSKVGIILYIISFAAMVFILLISYGSLGLVPGHERQVSTAITLALPFIAVRLLYSVISNFVHTKTFSIIGGNVGVLVGMSVIEEFIVVAIYLFLGFRLQKLEAHQQGELASRAWKDKRSRRGHRSRSDGMQQGQHSSGSPAGHPDEQTAFNLQHYPQQHGTYSPEDRV